MSNAEWIAVSLATGSGPSPVSFRVAPTNGPARSGSLTIAVHAFTVTQREGCSFQLSPALAVTPRSCVILGAPGYVAPELVSAVAAFDGRADIYALGCVAYWLVTGRRPYEGSDAGSILIRQWESEPEPPSRHAGCPLPDGFDQIVLDCLSKDPARRPPDAEAFAARLDDLPLDREWDQQRTREWWAQHAAEYVRT